MSWRHEATPDAQYMAKMNDAYARDDAMERHLAHNGALPIQPPESRPDPACERCNGCGWIVIELPQRCHHMRGCIECAEDYDEDCPDCGGTGRVKCDECREFDAVAWDGKDAVCAACKADRERIDRLADEQAA